MEKIETIDKWHNRGNSETHSCIGHITGPVLGPLTT